MFSQPKSPIWISHRRKIHFIPPAISFLLIASCVAPPRRRLARPQFELKDRFIAASQPRLLPPLLQSSSPPWRALAWRASCFPFPCALPTIRPLEGPHKQRSVNPLVRCLLQRVGLPLTVAVVTVTLQPSLAIPISDIFAAKITYQPALTFCCQNQM